MRREAKIALLQLIHVAAWAAYFTISRQVYNGDPSYLVRLAAAETLPTIAGLLGGWLSERYGYRVPLLIGIFEGIGLVLAGIYLGDGSLLLIIMFAASLAWSIAGPQIYAYTLTSSGGRGESLGIATAGATLGYTLGSLAPIPAAVLGGGPILAAMGATVIAVYIALAAMAGPSKPVETAGNGEGPGPLRFTGMIIASALAFTGVEIIGSVYMARLSREVGTTLYSIANAAAGLIGAVARPLAGRLVDEAGSTRVLAATLIAYAAYTLILDKSRGIAMALLWTLPLYPLLELSLVKHASSLAGEAMGTAIVSSSYSITGTILLVAGVLGLSGAPLLALAVSSFLLATTLILAVAPGRWRAGEVPPRGRGERNI